MGLPVLLWGPRDERPDENGVRLRDSQCGLFATGKVLRRFGVPFTYMTNCRLTDPEFERGIKDFLAVCNVVDTFRHTRIPSDRTASVRLLVYHVQRGRAAGKIQHSAFPDSASGTDCGDEKVKSRGAAR